MTINNRLNSYISYLKEVDLVNFDIIQFYKHFKLGDRSTAEDIFKKCIGVLKREDSARLQQWAVGISSSNFELCIRTDVNQYWRDLKIDQSRKETTASAECSIYSELNIKFQNTPCKRKRANSDVTSTATSPSELKIKSPKSQWFEAGCDICGKLYELQSLAVKHIYGGIKQLPIETSVYELMAIQHVLLLKPEQNNGAMMQIFGEETLTALHASRHSEWVKDCPELTDQDILNIQKIIDDYQSQKISLKVANTQLCILTLEMNKIATRTVDAVRRLMEKLPLCQLLDAITSETELWSTYVDPVLNSLLSSPDERIHLRWTNQKDNEDGAERPDGILSVISQSRWGRNYGHGEVKIAEPTDNIHALSWDLCRLAFFNKSLINKCNTKSAFAFQVKGHSITAYVTELIADGVYTMTELATLDIPKSVGSLDILVSRKSLRQLSWIAYVFDEITKEKVDLTEDFQEKKRFGPKLSQLEELLSQKRDRTLPSTLRF